MSIDTHVASPSSGDLSYLTFNDSKTEEEKAYIGAEFQRQFMIEARRDPHTDSTVSQNMC